MNAHSDLVHAHAACSPQTAWQQRAIIAYPLLLVLGVLLVLPANAGPPLLHDSFAIDWVWADQFTAQLAHGIVYPRWLPLSNGGLGAPVFYYYPPLAFYLAGLFGLLGLATYPSVIAAFAAAFAASGFTCWHWLKGDSNHPLLGAMCFMAMPYHLLDYTLRGALAESVAIALIPVIAIGLRRIAEQRGGIVLTALAYAAIICTHLPLALLVSIFLIAPFSILHRRDLRGFAVAAMLGIALAAIYLIPALALEPYRDVSLMYRTPNLRTDYWSIYAGHLSDPTFHLVLLAVAAIILAAMIPAVASRSGWARYAIVLAVIVTGAVPFLWSIPLLAKVQFPYRALSIAEFALATAIARLPRRFDLQTIGALIPLALSATILPGFHLHGDDPARLEALHPDVYEYLPKGVLKPGETHARVSRIIGERRPLPAVPGYKVEPYFYFPAWSCGKQEPRTKLLMHKASCTPHLVQTPPEKIAAAISLSALVIALLLVAHRRRGLRGVALG
jgi:hypothetical protein